MIDGRVWMIERRNAGDTDWFLIDTDAPTSGAFFETWQSAQRALEQHLKYERKRFEITYELRAVAYVRIDVERSIESSRPIPTR